MPSSQQIVAEPALRDAVASRSYAAQRSQKRQQSRERIHLQVLHPIDTPSLLRDPLYHPKSKLSATVTVAKLLLAAGLVHGFVILAFSAVNGLIGERGGYRPAERLAVRIVEIPPPPPVVDEPEEIQGPIQPDFVPKKAEPPKPKKPDPPKRKKPKLEKVKPPPPVTETPAPVQRYRIPGLSQDSTVTGGKGPVMATGSSRMGKTSNVARDPAETARPPTAPPAIGNTGAQSGAERQQRVASRIPTRDIVFVNPKRIRAIKPPYPETLKAQGLEGDVQVRVSIDASGRVTAVTVLKGSGQEAFDDAAKQAARREQFEPARRDGKPVAFTLSYSYRFRIEDP